MEEFITFVKDLVKQTTNVWNIDTTKESKFIMYLDANSLYGRAVSQYLPYGKFRWLKTIDNFGVNSIKKTVQ